MEVGLLLCVALMSLVLTGWLRRYALARSLMDIPNARSSHVVPTPRGGGGAIVVSFLLALVFMGWAELAVRAELWAIGGAGALVALIGFLDDHGHIAARWRLLAHFVAAGWVLFWLGGMPALEFGGVVLPSGVGASVLAAIYLVWVLNLYNFMDGIDGIASVEAVCVCVGAALLYAQAGLFDQAWLPLALAAAVLGFLVWNFPPAKIFMGDAGSGFLGIILGAMAIQAAWARPVLFWAWIILLGVFIVDATYTLLRRLMRGEKVYEAHRSHAYQYASREFGHHLPVTLAVGVINLVWLLPIALLVGNSALDGMVGVVLAYIPLVALAIRFRAGELERC